MLERQGRGQSQDLYDVHVQRLAQGLRSIEASRPLDYLIPVLGI